MLAENTHIDEREGSGEVQLNGYYLTRAWYDFVENNPDRISPTHAALYFYCVDLCNRLGWKKQFGLPAAVAMAMTGIKSYNTYAKTLRELVEFGAIRIVAMSSNQYTANTIALSNFDVALDEANNDAQYEATNTANTVYINNKPVKNKLINNSISDRETCVSHSARTLKKGYKKDKNTTVFKEPTLEEVTAYCAERGNNISPDYFIDYYKSIGWQTNGSRINDWKAKVHVWERNAAIADRRSITDSK